MYGAVYTAVFNPLHLFFNPFPTWGNLCTSSRKPNKDNDFHASVTSRHCMGSMMYVEIFNQEMKIDIVSCDVYKGD